jgi:hypothetical protein
MKIYLIFFALSFASSSYGNLLNDWSNDDLCGWMESSSTPEHIQKEVSEREIICFGGVEVFSLPVSSNSITENGTVFPSPDSTTLEQLKSYADEGDNQVMGSSY